MPQYLLAQTGDVTSRLSAFWQQNSTFIIAHGLNFAVNVAAALAILLVGRWASKLVKRICAGILMRAKIDETLTKFLANIVYALLMAFVVIASIDRMGVDTTSFAAIMAAGGLAIGLALQGSLSNFAAGVMLILFKPFQLGDYIDAGGSSGVVEEIHIFNTMMRTGDNIQIIVPNSQINSGTITNYSAKDTRRIDLVVGCGYEDDLKAVKQFLEELIAGDERILADPEPFVAVNELGESSVNFVVRPWVNSSDYWPVRRELTEKIKVGFDENGFNIPYPTRDVHVHGMTA